MSRVMKQEPADKEKVRYKALLDKHGICDNCGEFFVHDYIAPFASCACCTSEWYELTPSMASGAAHNEVVNTLHATTNERDRLRRALAALRLCLDPEDYMGDVSMHSFIDEALLHGKAAEDEV
jgi:hypothetical protein